MNLNQIQRFHFIGIGGIGMSGLAEILLRRGHEVSGCDLKDSALLQRLREMGAGVFIGHDPAHLEGAQAVVFSSAVPVGSPELSAARKRGLPTLPRGELLAELMRPRKGITISGTHGKTTTTSMIGLVLLEAGLDPTIVVGARLQTIGSNARLGQSPWFVAEADESDRSFLLLSPHCAVVTNIDLDHMDEYRDLEDLQKAFQKHLGRVAEQGLVVACADDPNLQAVLKKLHRPVVTYGLRPGADFSAQQVELRWLGSTYECFSGDRGLGQVKLYVPGEHNVQNSLAAVAVGAGLLELPMETIARALGAFRGAERRLQWKGEKGGVWVMDDYGHHPAEIRAVLATCRLSGRRTLVVFQPHRYSRTRHLMEDLGRCFDTADILYLMPIYGAGEKPIPGVTGGRLARQIARHREVRYIRQRPELLADLRKEAREGDLLLTLGAGDVWQIGEAFLEANHG